MIERAWEDTAVKSILAAQAAAGQKRSEQETKAVSERTIDKLKAADIVAGGRAYLRGAREGLQKD